MAIRPGLVALGVLAPLQPLLSAPALAQSQGSTTIKPPSTTAPAVRTPGRTTVPPSTWNRPPTYQVLPIAPSPTPKPRTTPLPPSNTTVPPSTWNRPPTYQVLPIAPSPTPKPRTTPLPPSNTTVPPSTWNRPPTDTTKPPRSLALLRPTLFCRSFVNPGNQQKVPGFRAPLSGREPSSMANALAQQLRAYQQQGGSLSRCVYSGYLSPSLLAGRFNGQSPTAAVRTSDGYRLPIYDNYQAFLAANKGFPGRFGLIASQPLVRSSTGSAKAVRISINNALVFFVDSRNQGLFQLEPANLSIQLMPRSPEVQQVLAEMSKASLQSLINFKRNKGRMPMQSLQQSLHRLAAIDGRTVLIAARGVVPVMPADLPTAYPAQRREAFDWRSEVQVRSEWIAQIVPSAYCKVQSSFYPLGFCAELESKSIQELVQCESVFVGRDRELTLCRLLFDEIVKIQGATPPAAVGSGSTPTAPDPGTASADPGVGTGTEIVEEGEVDLIVEEGSAGEGDSGQFDGDATGDVVVDNSFDDPAQMLPEGMGVPVAAACNATTFGEQMMCALLTALTSLLQQAFSSSAP